MEQSRQRPVVRGTNCLAPPVRKLTKPESQKYMMATIENQQDLPNGGFPIKAGSSSLLRVTSGAHEVTLHAGGFGGMYPITKLTNFVCQLIVTIYEKLPLEFNKAVKA